ncbi:MAG: PIN/TRAM domain-containing protein [Cyanobacteria bacterium P01_F01_bin.153]
MIDTLIILSFLIVGVGVGFFAVDSLPESALAEVTNRDGLNLVIGGFGALMGGIVGLTVQAFYRRTEERIKAMPVDRLLVRSVGLVIGLLVANLLLAPVFLLPIPWKFAFIKPLLAIFGSIVVGFTGVSLADTQGRALLRLINPSSAEALLISEGTLKPAKAKVLDTSCIIDGRISDLLDTGFLEGQILVPQFVLQELQYIADAANDQKRVRGRRGLDILNKIRDSHGDRIVIHRADYDDINTVDAKLVRLAQESNAALLTNDFNLNKVATVQDVTVLNVNDLMDALRPSYLPGDSLELKVLRQGKEPEQGVGYLTDGTMVVVETGNRYVGDELEVVVTSSLQTSAGRMIFARPAKSVVA